jgi:hypothetical protein
MLSNTGAGRLGLPSLALAVVFIASGISERANAQSGYYAAIAYSQKTGKVGHTARQARSEQAAKQLAINSCGAADAKVFTWAQDQWVAVATADGVVGTAGFARAFNADEAQRRALAECQKSAKGGACRVVLCVHSSGMQPRQLLALARDPKLPPLPPPAPKSGYYAAIALSPSTGKIGYSSGKARTKEEAQQLAAKQCGAKDAKAFMWGDQWVAVAVAEGNRGIAGFGPGATRELAEKTALAECQKLAKGAPCKIELAVHSSGKTEAELAKAAAAPKPDAAADGQVKPASAESPAKAKPEEAKPAEKPAAEKPAAARPAAPASSETES